MAGAFAGKAIIVTGASSGLGRAIAVELGGAGAELWLTGRNTAELEATAALIADLGGPAAHCAPMDLAQRGPLGDLIREVGASHPHLFALINNAGVMYPEPVMEGTIARWQAMLDINVMAMLEGSQAAVTAMRAHGKPGHIVNISSVQSRFEEPGVYGISKKAALMFTDTLRAELEQDDIRVSTVVPGGFSTQLSRDFTPSSLETIGGNMAKLGIEWGGPGSDRVIGDPQHIANAVRYILEQPIGINVQEMVVRPPISTKA